jgi:Cu(I)/Ag(I) efflux system protein CusF
MEISMKPITLTTIVLAAVLWAPAGFAQQKMDDMKGMEMPKKAAPDAQVTHQATGVVKKIDAKAGIVTFAHEPVPSMKWPAMTMGFQVQDRMLLDKLSVGQKVSFDFVQGKKGYVVTAVK